jgi:hypothetical protein
MFCSVRLGSVGLVSRSTDIRVDFLFFFSCFGFMRRLFLLRGIYHLYELQFNFFEFRDFIICTMCHDKM